MSLFGKDHTQEELEIIEHLIRENSRLVGIVDRLTERKEPPPCDNVITSLRVTKISINNLIIQGQIMIVTISKTQKVVQTVTGLNAALQNVPLGHLAGLSATIDNPAVAIVGPIDTVNQLVTVVGVSDGPYNITYTGTNDLGATVTFTEGGTIADADNVITSLTTASGTPSAQ